MGRVVTVMKGLMLTVIRCRLFFFQAAIDQPAGYASLQSNLVSLHLLHPVHVLPLAASTNSSIAAAFLPAFHPLRSGLPCDVHLLNLRTLLESEDGSKFSPSDVTGLILHRFGVDCRFAAKGVSCRFNDGQVLVLYRKNNID